MKRYKTLGLLMFIAAAIMFIAWGIISLIYNLSNPTLVEQFTMPIKLSLVGYGIAVLSIFITAVIGMVINGSRKKKEPFFGFLYFSFFSLILILMYLTVFYEDIIK